MSSYCYQIKYTVFKNDKDIFPEKDWIVVYNPSEDGLENVMTNLLYKLRKSLCYTGKIELHITKLHAYDKDK